MHLFPKTKELEKIDYKYEDCLEKFLKVTHK